MRKSIVLVALLLLVLGGSVMADLQDAVTFTVTIDNISGIGLFDNTGVAAIPVESGGRRTSLPGSAYQFDIEAQPGDTLTFATMLAQSNDLFFAPDEHGIALYDTDGEPISGDVTELVDLWDAGTEVNQPIGQGDQQGAASGRTEFRHDEMVVRAARQRTRRRLGLPRCGRDHRGNGNPLRFGQVHRAH